MGIRVTYDQNSLWNKEGEYIEYIFMHFECNIEWIYHMRQKKWDGKNSNRHNKNHCRVARTWNFKKIINIYHEERKKELKFIPNVFTFIRNRFFIFWMFTEIHLDILKIISMVFGNNDFCYESVRQYFGVVGLNSSYNGITFFFMHFKVSYTRGIGKTLFFYSNFCHNRWEVEFFGTNTCVLNE